MHREFGLSRFFFDRIIQAGTVNISQTINSCMILKKLVKRLSYLQLTNGLIASILQA